MFYKIIAIILLLPLSLFISACSEDSTDQKEEYETSDSPSESSVKKTFIRTVTGDIDSSKIKSVLPHEHLIVDFSAENKGLPESYDRQEAVEVMLPYLLELKNAGVNLFFDPTPEFLGRDPIGLRELSEQSGVYIVINTGYYMAPFLPDYIEEISTEDLARIWIDEAENGIGETGIRPGFIKIALNTGRLIPVQEKILRAALIASENTGLAIQAHTIGGEAIQHAIEIMEEESFNIERFIWVHADAEEDINYLIEAAEKGMWIEIDSIGIRPYEEHFEMISGLIDKGFTEKILISQDAGWYSIGEPQGGNVRPFHELFTEFIPQAVEWGISEEKLERIVTENPINAMGLKK